MKTTGITVKVDLREKGAEEIERILATRHNLTVIRKFLPAGDYLINDTIIVERKTIRNFYQAITRGRLFKQTVNPSTHSGLKAGACSGLTLSGALCPQLKNRGLGAVEWVKMKLFFSSVLLIVEGENSDSPYHNINPLCVKGCLVNLAVKWKIPVLFSYNMEETAIFLGMIGSQHRRRRKIVPIWHPKHKGKLRQQQVHFLSGLPGIGQTLATRLLSRFSSIEKTIDASEEELRTTYGIGGAKAKKIKEIIRKES